MPERTIISRGRLALLRHLALGVKALAGDVAEVGVYKGGSAKMLAELLPEKAVHLFDTFEGMPDMADEFDNTHKAGDFADTSLEEVTAFLASCSNAVLHPGIFPRTAFPVEDCEFALVHVDCDLHQSVLACCSFFYPRMVDGGVIVFDDYHEPTCLGAKKAVDEFFADKLDKPRTVGQGCYVRCLGEGNRMIEAIAMLAAYDRRFPKDSGTTPAEKLFLYSLCLLYRPKRVIELGCCVGHSTAWLALGVKACGGRVISVDNYSKTHGGVTDSPEQARQRLEANALDSVVELVVMDSQEFMASQEADSAEIVWVDAAHDYDGALHDIREAMRVASKLVVVHDICHPLCPGVRLACDAAGGGTFIDGDLGLWIRNANGGN